MKVNLKKKTRPAYSVMKISSKEWMGCYIREDYLLSMCIIFMYLNDDISIWSYATHPPMPKYVLSLYCCTRQCVCPTFRAVGIQILYLSEVWLFSFHHIWYYTVRINHLYSVHDKNYLKQDILLCHIFQKWSQQWSKKFRCI